MHILITRPQSDALEWQRLLERHGVTATVDPLLRIEHLNPSRLKLQGVQAVIVTSRNGLRWLEAGASDRPEITCLPLFAVGLGTAELARTLGFATIHTGPASAQDLVPLITAHAVPDGGYLLHLSGDKIAFDLAAFLKPAGFRVNRAIVYRSSPAQHLQPGTLIALANGAIDTVMLMSPLSAGTFVALVNAAGLREQCQRLVYICLSQNVAQIVRSLNPVSVHVAVKPNGTNMLALIERLATAVAPCGD